MDSTRARQILQAKENINVMYQGSPVWIEGVSENMAEVTSMDSSKSRQKVPVDMLVEKI